MGLWMPLVWNRIVTGRLPGMDELNKHQLAEICHKENHCAALYVMCPGDVVPWQQKVKLHFTDMTCCMLTDMLVLLSSNWKRGRVATVALPPRRAQWERQGAMVGAVKLSNALVSCFAPSTQTASTWSQAASSPAYQDVFVTSWTNANAWIAKLQWQVIRRLSLGKACMILHAWVGRVLAVGL